MICASRTDMSSHLGISSAEGSQRYSGRSRSSRISGGCSTENGLATTYRQGEMRSNGRGGRQPVSSQRMRAAGRTNTTQGAITAPSAALTPSRTFGETRWQRVHSRSATAWAYLQESRRRIKLVRFLRAQPQSDVGRRTSAQSSASRWQLALIPSPSTVAVRSFPEARWRRASYSSGAAGGGSSRRRSRASRARRTADHAFVILL